MSRRRVLVTGAAGTIFSRMIDAFRDRYDLVLLDVHGHDRSGVLIPGIEIADLTDPDRDAYRHHFAGVDAVLHCAFVGNAGTAPSPAASDESSARFQRELRNVQMAYNVYQVALEEGVRRVVVCSSNHAADWYERLIWTDRHDVVDPDMKTYSDNYYGWAKEAYEDLGFVFATGVENGGRALENVQLRIGGPRETDIDGCGPDDLRRVRRALGVYLSQRDQVQLAVRSIEADDIRDDHGVPFQIFYGISANDHAFWSIVNARRVIGYEPEDNSAVRFADRIAEIMTAARRSSGPPS